MNTELRNKFLAGYAGIYLTSFEEKRVEAELLEIAKSIGYGVYVWTITDSIVGPLGTNDIRSFKNGDEPFGPVEMLEQLNKVLPEKSIVIAKDYHLFVAEANPVLVRRMKDCLAEARLKERRLVILGCVFKLCTELEKEFTAVEFALPDRPQLKLVADGIATSAGIALNGHTEELLDAASGLTTIEAEDAFALAAIESNKQAITPAVVAREKCGVVRKSGLLDILDTNIDLTRVGGNHLIKEWIDKRKRAFSKEAVAYKLPIPKGILLIGVAGCGKSMIGKAIAKKLNVPLLKLDGGKLFGSLVGASEQNTRTMIHTAEAVAPCVLFIDEFEKALSGSKSSGSTDGGTASRVLGTLLQWLQDKTSPVFVVATANDISALPPELLRKGRWDEMFFVDLPTASEREEIVSVVVQKFDRKAEDFDCKAIAAVTDGFTGAEIEGAFTEAMFEAFSENHEPKTVDVLTACADVVPIQTTMREQIDALRKWCDGRACHASEKAPVQHKESTGRKL